MKLHVKKNDMVKVISGDSKGTTGKVLKVYVETGRVLVEGVNIITRHTKPNATYPQGGRITKEAPIHASNVMIIDPKTNDVSRLGHKMVKDEKTGKLKSYRMSKKSGEIID